MLKSPPHLHLYGQDLGLQEMPDSYDSNSDQSGGSRVSEEFEGGGALSSDLFLPKCPRLS